MADKFNRSELSGLSAQHKGLLVGAGALVLFGLTRKSKLGWHSRRRAVFWHTRVHAERCLGSMKT